MFTIFEKRGFKKTASYDSEVGTLYLRVLEATATNEHLAEEVPVGYAADGRVPGVEILDAQKRFGDIAVLRRVVLETSC